MDEYNYFFNLSQSIKEIFDISSVALSKDGICKALNTLFEKQKVTKRTGVFKKEEIDENDEEYNNRIKPFFVSLPDKPQLAEFYFREYIGQDKERLQQFLEFLKNNREIANRIFDNKGIRESVFKQNICNRYGQYMHCSYYQMLTFDTPYTLQSYL